MPWVMDCKGGTQGFWKERLRTITPKELHKCWEFLHACWGSCPSENGFSADGIGEVSGGGEKHIGSGRHRKDGERGLQRWG